MGSRYQLTKPETFNAYPSELSGYYGLNSDCLIDFEGSQAGILQLADYYSLDDIRCGYIGSSIKNDWYTLHPQLTCKNEHKIVSPIQISFKAAGKDKLRVIFGDHEEAIYHRCGWKAQ